jgi:hypothetical protein
MAFLRYLTFLALAAWVGGLAVLGGIAAPVVFAGLQAEHGMAGREIAGLLFGTMLERFQYVAWGAAAVLFLSYGLRAALGPRPRRTAVRIWTVTAMLAMSLITMFVLIPNIELIREGLDGAVALLPETEPRRISFGRLHGASTGLMLATILCGLGLAWAEMRDQY